MKLSSAAKVAAAATALITVVYVIAVIVLNVLVSAHLIDQNDYRLTAQLTAAARDPSLLGQQVAPLGPGLPMALDLDADTAPIFLWAVTAAGTVIAHSQGAPELPSDLFAAHPPHDKLAFTATIGSADVFRLKLARHGSGWLIAGQSRAGDAHTMRLLLYAEVIAGPFVLLAMFFGSLVVGRGRWRRSSTRAAASWSSPPTPRTSCARR